MKKMIVMFAVVSGVLSGVAMGMSTTAVEDKIVEQKIDARLHDLLVKARLGRQSH